MMPMSLVLLKTTNPVHTGLSWIKSIQFGNAHPVNVCLTWINTILDLLLHGLMLASLLLLREAYANHFTLA